MDNYYRQNNDVKKDVYNGQNNSTQQNSTVAESDKPQPDEIKEDTTNKEKKKRLDEMDNTEKMAYYDSVIESFKKKIKEAEEKKDRIGNVTEKQRNHALIQFGSHFISKEQLYKWYQLPAKERNKAIDDYAEEIKKKAQIGGKVNG